MTSDAVEPVLIYPDELINQLRTQFLVRNILFNLKRFIKNQIQGNGESGDRDVLASVTRVESVGNIKKTEILRIKQVQLTYLDQPAETDVKSKQLSDLADLISKGEYYFRIAIITTEKLNTLLYI